MRGTLGKPRLWALWSKYTLSRRWGYEGAYLTKREATARARELRRDGYETRVLPYVIVIEY